MVKKKATTINTLPYNKFCKNDITMLTNLKKGNNKYSKTFEFSDIAYNAVRQEDREEKFLDYCKILNQFNNVNVQINIINSPLDAQLLYESIEVKNNMFEEHTNIFNSILKDKILSGANKIKQRKFITVTVSSEDEESANHKFINFETSIRQIFRKLKSELRAVKNVEKVQLLADIYRDDSPYLLNKKFNYRNKEEKMSIAPMYANFNKDYIEFENKFSRSITLTDLPSSIYDNVIDDICSVYSGLLSINIEPVETQKAHKIIDRKLLDLKSSKLKKQQRANQKGFSADIITDKVDGDIENAIEFKDGLRKNNQKMFYANITATIIETSKEKLDKKTEELKSIASRHICKFRTLHFQQEDGFKQTLPLGNNTLQIKRALQTESLAVFSPFSSANIMDVNGFCYGVHQETKNILQLDRTTLNNTNGFILGTSGAGKGMFTKWEMLNPILKTDDDIIVIDPENEYELFVKAFNGEVINISSSSTNHINLFDVPLNDDDVDEDPVALKSGTILSICELLLNDSDGLKATDKSILDRCVRLVYSDFINGVTDKAPTMVDFYNIIKEQEEMEAKNIALALEIYATGNQSIFSKETNVDINNRLICFNLRDLNKSMQTFALIVVLDFIWQRVLDNYKKGKRTWVYVDEMHILFKNTYSADFLEEVFKRIRKYDGTPTGITQNATDVLASKQGYKMISNSEFIVMLKQEMYDRQKLEEMFNLSDTQLEYVTNSEKGKGLIKHGNSILPFENVIPDDNALYNLMSTNPNEKAKKKKV